nr:MAG TPA: hypothetical protein [Caudoviricetes sp.]
MQEVKTIYAMLHHKMKHIMYFFHHNYLIQLRHFHYM